MYSQDEVHALIAEKNAALAENERIKQQLTKELSDALAETAGMRIIYNMVHEEYALCRKILMERGAQLAALRAKAFQAGWETAAAWMERDDLLADIDSPAYIADRDAALRQILEG